MDNWIESVIKQKLAKTFGLKEAIVKAHKEQDKRLLDGSLEGLAYLTGFQFRYLKNNLNHIVKL